MPSLFLEVCGTRQLQREEPDRQRAWGEQKTPLGAVVVCQCDPPSQLTCLEPQLSSLTSLRPP